MPCRLLIKARDSQGSGAGQYHKGDIVLIRPATHVWGGMEGLPDFIQLDISDADVEDLQQLDDKEWRQDLDWEVVGSDPSVDGWRLLVWCKTRRARDGLGDVTLDQAQNYLERWGAFNVVGDAFNGAQGVRFDVTVYAAATSAGFLNADDEELAAFSFRELAYTQVGGLHDIRMTYPPTYAHATMVSRIAGTGGTVLAEDAEARQIDYQVPRALILDTFKDDLKAKLEVLLRRRRKYFDPAAVDQVIGVGGALTRTAVQAQANLRDAFND